MNRNRTQVETLNYIRNNIDCDFIINLGNSGIELNEPHFMWNSAEWVAPLLTPGATRKLMPIGYLPAQPEPDSWGWLKAPGRGGSGKTQRFLPYDFHLPRGWDTQKHIEGEEYRVITVGMKVVQVTSRAGTNENREYRWLGLSNTPSEVKSKARSAAANLQGTNVIGWDLIQDKDENVYILEGNACPGVNDATAQRVVDEIYRQREEEREVNNAY